MQRRARYQRTASGACVDMQALERLASLGYARALTAEALRQVKVGLAWDIAAAQSAPFLSYLTDGFALNCRLVCLRCSRTQT